MMNITMMMMLMIMMMVMLTVVVLIVGAVGDLVTNEMDVSVSDYYFDNNISLVRVAPTRSFLTVCSNTTISEKEE